MNKFLITQRAGDLRKFLIVALWLWSLIGGLGVAATVIQANGMNSLGVGTSMAVTMNVIAWFAVAMILGLAALLSPIEYDVRLVEDKNPVEGSRG